MLKSLIVKLRRSFFKFFKNWNLLLHLPEVELAAVELLNSLDVIWFCMMMVLFVARVALREAVIMGVVVILCEGAQKIQDVNRGGSINGKDGRVRRGGWRGTG